MATMNSIGVGFGPSNIALAIALEERGMTGKASGHVFFDSRTAPDWHPGLMYEEATMQISFLKDLITMVNPQSRYTFLNYIHASGRMHEFINLRTFHPRRTEFESYVKWCAEQLTPFAEFNSRISDVRLSKPEAPAKSDLTVSVTSQVTGKVQHLRTKSLVIADGGMPTWPLSKPQSAYMTVFHSGDTLHRLATLGLDKNSEHQFHIVGSGQSAADTFAYLATTYPNSKIVMSHRSYAMRPEDDSHFVNELFMPHAVDEIFGLAPNFRKKVIKDYWHVTHNGVTIDLLPKLYEMVYYDRANGQNRFTFNKFSEITDAVEQNGHGVAHMRRINDDTNFEVAADVTILSTGYDRPCPHPLLHRLSEYLEISEDGANYEMDRDYKILAPSTSGFEIYLQGYSENTHGFSEALLSLMPERASEIAHGILRRPSANSVAAA